MNEVIQKQNDDTIDLFKIFTLLYNKRKFIFFFTLIFTLLGFFYGLNKVPIYEAKAFIKTSTIYNQTKKEFQPLEDIYTIKNKIVYNFKAIPKFIKKEDLANGAVYNVKIIDDENGNTNSLKNLEIYIRGYDKNKLISKAKEVLKFINNEEKSKLELYQTVINAKIKSLESKIAYQENNASILRYNINNIEQETLPTLYQSIQTLQKSIEILNKTNSKNTIFSDIEKLSNLQYKLNDLNIQKNKLLMSLQSLKNDLNTTLPMHIKELSTSLDIAKIELSNIKTSKILGDILVSDKEVGLNRIFITQIALIMGIILAILIITLKESIKNFKIEENRIEK
nr:hypothetical protein [Campylobacter sp.]